MLPAEWPQNTVTAKSGCRRPAVETVARRSLLSRTQLHHVCKIFTSVNSVILKSKSLRPGPVEQEEEDSGRCCMQQGMAMFTSPVDHRWLSSPRSVLSFLTRWKSRNKQAFVLIQGGFSIRPGAGNSRIGVRVHGVWRGCSSAARQEGRDRAVPWLGLNYALHPLCKWMGARSECTWAQPPPPLHCQVCTLVASMSLGRRRASLHYKRCHFTFAFLMRAGLFIYSNQFTCFKRFIAFQ